MAGRLADRHGPRVTLTAGTLLLGLSLGWLALVLRQDSYIWLVPGYMGIGLALGFSIPPATTDALNTADRANRSEASGITQMNRQVGGSVGLAILGAIVAAAQSEASGHTATALRAAMTTGTADAYRVAAAVMLAVSVAAFALVRRAPASDAAQPSGSRRQAEVAAA